MKTITDIINNVIELVPNDNNEYTLFIQYNFESKELYLELSNELENMVVDSNYNLEYLNSRDILFYTNYDWELRLKLVKPMITTALADRG